MGNDVLTTGPQGPAYRIRTHRLVIRCWNPTDAEMIHAPLEVSSAHLCDCVPWHQGEPVDLQARIERLRRIRSEFDSGQQLMYGIFNCEETQVLGNCGLQSRVSTGARVLLCWIYKDFVNQGLATESVSGLIRVAFEIHQVKRLEMHTDPDNTRSTAVPGKLGFVHEATLRKCDETVSGERRDSMVWSLIKEDYSRCPAANAEVTAYDVLGRRLL